MVSRLTGLAERVRHGYEVVVDALRTARSRADEPDREFLEPAEELATADLAQPEPAAERGPAERGLAERGLAERGPVERGLLEPKSVNDAVPHSLQVAAAWSWRLIVVGIVGLALLWLVQRFMLLVAPLMIGLLLAGLLMPAQRGLLRLGLNRSLAALLVVVAGLAAVGGTLTLVVNAFIAGLDEMVTSVESGVVQVERWLRTGPLGLDDAALADMAETLQTWVQDNTERLTTAGLSAIAGTVQFLTGMVLALVITYFFLRDGRRIWGFLVGMLPRRARAPMMYAGEGAWRSLGGYVRATVLVALVDAIGIGIGLYVLDLTLGMPMVLPLAALVFLGAFVPIVGAFVSGLVAVLVALVSDADPAIGLVKALIVLGIVVVVQQLEGNVLQPFIVSKIVRIHPLAVIVAVMAGILLAGIIGALVAVPVVAVLNTVVRRLHQHHLRGAAT